MCKAFTEVVDLATDDECRTCAILDWIKLQVTELMSTKSCGTNNIVLQYTIHLSSQCTHSQTTTNDSIGDPNVQRKMAHIEDFEEKVCCSRC